MDTSAHSPHRRAWDTLPWLVAGSASPDDTAQALQHLAACAECRDELAFQQRVHAGLQAHAPEVQTLPDPGPALQRLLARLDVAAAADAADAADGVAHAAADRAGAVARSARPAPAAAAGWARWLVAAVVVQAVGLGAAGLVLLEHHRDADYRTLGQAATPVRTATLRLVPAPGMDFGALRALLVSTRLELVEVSADGGSLGLAPQDGDPATTAAALPVLRSAPQVMLVEPLR